MHALLLHLFLIVLTPVTPLLSMLTYCYYDCQARCIIHVRTSIAANEAVSKKQKMNGWAMGGWVGALGGGGGGGGGGGSYMHMNHMHEVIKFSWEACACRLIRRQNCSS